MKKYMSLLLALFLTLSLGACQKDDRKAAEQTEASTPSAPVTTPVKPVVPENNSQAVIAEKKTISEEELHDIVLNFGAEENSDGKLIVQPVSLFHSKNWSSDRTTVSQLLTWYMGYVEREDLSNEEKTEKYKHPLDETKSPFFPQDVIEPVLQTYFDVNPDQLRKDDSYDAQLKGYLPQGGWGQDLLPALSIEGWDEQDQLLHIYLRASYEKKVRADQLLCLTVQLLEDGYHYLSYEWVIEQDYVVDVVLGLGAEKLYGEDLAVTTNSKLSDSTEGGFSADERFHVNGWKRWGDQLRITLCPTVMTPEHPLRFLTVRLKENFEYEFLSLSTSPVNSALIEDIVLNFGAKHAPQEDGSFLLQPQDISLYHGDGWSLSDCNPGDFFFWYWGYRYRDNFSYAEEKILYAHPDKNETAFFFPQDLYEDAIQQHFIVSTELLRSDEHFYDAELQGYWSKGYGGKGELPTLTIGSYEQSDNKLRIPVTRKDSGGSETFWLTVLLEDNGNYFYQSFLPESKLKVQLQELATEGEHNSIRISEYHEDELILFRYKQNKGQNTLYFQDTVSLSEDGSQKSLDIDLFLDSYCNDEDNLYYIDSEKKQLIQLFRRAGEKTVLCPVSVGERSTSVYRSGSYLLWTEEDGLSAYDLANQQKVSIFDPKEKISAFGISHGNVSVVAGKELWTASLSGGPASIQTLKLGDGKASNPLSNGRYVIYLWEDEVGSSIRCHDLNDDRTMTFGRDRADHGSPALLGDKYALYWAQDGQLIIYDLEKSYIAYQNPELNVSALLANDEGNKVALISNEDKDQLYLLTLGQ